MSNTASQPLCQELYELLGWGNDPTTGDNSEYVHHESMKGWVTHPRTHFADGNIPAYTLGYLMRKLPPVVTDEGMNAHWLLVQPLVNTGDKWAACYRQPLKHKPKVMYDNWAPTPEDAVCKLGIELAKAGILKRGES